MHLLQVIQRQTDRFSVLRKKLSRRAVFTGVVVASMLAICISAVGTLPARATTIRDSSAAGFAAAATSYQNKALDAVMTRVAGGTRVSASEVEWDGGQIIFGVSAAGASAQADVVTPEDVVDTTGAYNYNKTMGNELNCLDGYFCAWGSTALNGTCYMYIAGDYAGYELDWAAYSDTYCSDVGTWSWWNRTDERVWKEANFPNATPSAPYFYDGGTPSGNTWCISPGVSNGDVTDGISRTLGWIFMSFNTAGC
jgi:hypothetical protein